MSSLYSKHITSSSFIMINPPMALLLRLSPRYGLIGLPRPPLSAPQGCQSGSPSRLSPPTHTLTVWETPLFPPVYRRAAGATRCSTCVWARVTEGRWGGAAVAPGARAPR